MVPEPTAAGHLWELDLRPRAVVVRRDGFGFVTRLFGRAGVGGWRAVPLVERGGARLAVRSATTPATTAVALRPRHSLVVQRSDLDNGQLLLVQRVRRGTRGRRWPTDLMTAPIRVSVGISGRRSAAVEEGLSAGPSAAIEPARAGESAGHGDEAHLRKVVTTDWSRAGRHSTRSGAATRRTLPDAAALHGGCHLSRSIRSSPPPESRLDLFASDLVGRLESPLPLVVAQDPLALHTSFEPLHERLKRLTLTQHYLHCSSCGALTLPHLATGPTLEIALVPRPDTDSPPQLLSAPESSHRGWPSQSERESARRHREARLRIARCLSELGDTLRAAFQVLRGRATASPAPRRYHQYSTRGRRAGETTRHSRRPSAAHCAARWR